MELVTSLQYNKHGDILEYKLNDQDELFILTNAATHTSDEIYKLIKMDSNPVNNKFKIEHSGNKALIIDNIDHNIVQYIILQEKESKRYLLSVESFRKMFTEIN